MSQKIRVRRHVLARLVKEARRSGEIECCGLLAGAGGVISEILPARNALASATKYEIAAEELFGFFRKIRAHGLDHLGIYHSHPATESFPSTSDIERAYYPDAAYFIISPRADAPRPVRAFRIAESRVEELEIVAE